MPDIRFPRPSSPLIFLLLLSSLQATLAQNVRPCYWPDGNQTTTVSSGEYRACTSDTHTQCCNKGDSCLSNGLCHGPKNGLVYRGGCTDSQWKDKKACPSLCSEVKTTGPVSLFPCPANSDGEWKWWCGDTTKGRTCYTDDKSTFFFWDQAKVGDVAGSDPSDSSPSSPSSTSSPPNSPSEPPEESTESSVPGACGQGSLKGMVDKSVPLGVGLGVGIPLLLFTAAFATLYFRERKTRINAQNLVSHNAAVHGHGLTKKTSGFFNPKKPESPVEMDGTSLRELPH